MTCPVCGGVGFVKAAPLSVPARSRPWGKGQERVFVGANMRRRVLWNNAITVPCWACAGMPVIT
jgi:hypothetical protein